MDKIKLFLSGNGYGDGNGNGDGNGYGYGDGNGNGYGNGYGNGNGDGNGDGYGYGYGNGDGNGDGYGDGYGDGNGDGNGNGVKLHTYLSKPVYYIDGIPCIFKSVVRNFAKVSIIDNTDFSLSDQFVCKFNVVFAHGNTLEKARQDAERKYYSELDQDAAIDKFLESFTLNKDYSNTEFYKWHSILTGSCDSGKDYWMKENGIDLNGKMTAKEFLNVTKGAYGGEVIEKIIERLED
jgi:hypothetical protein